MTYLLAVILTLALAGGAQAKVITQTVEYKQDGAVLEGYLAYDDAIRALVPACW